MHCIAQALKQQFFYPAAGPAFARAEWVWRARGARAPQGVWGGAPSGVKRRAFVGGLRGLKLKAFCPFSYKRGANDGKS